MEPAFLLLPIPVNHSTVGPCTSLAAVDTSIFTSSSSSAVEFASGHLNGWVILWSLYKRRVCHQWLAHADSQITSLEVWYCHPQHSVVLLSQGRDGWIRLWGLDFLFSKELLKPGECPLEIMPPFRTCGVTFCKMNLWFEHTVNSSLVSCRDNTESAPCMYLAHVARESDCDQVSEAGDQNIIAVVQLSSTSTILRPTAWKPSNSSKLGMCMSLQGVEWCPEELAMNAVTTNPGWLLLIAFESGDVFLVKNGYVLTQLTHVLGVGVPIMSMALQPPRIPSEGNPAALKDVCYRLIAICGPSVEVMDQTSNDVENLSFLRLQTNGLDSEISHILTRSSHQLQSKSTVGIASIAWRRDARLVCFAQWDGELLLVQHRLTSGRLRCLGWLSSIGGLDSGELVGEWAATTVRKPHGPTVDQQSRTVRTCMFLPESNWLLTAAPANAGSCGTILVWDVYRT